MPDARTPRRRALAVVATATAALVAAGAWTASAQVGELPFGSTSTTAPGPTSSTSTTTVTPLGPTPTNPPSPGRSDPPPDSASPAEPLPAASDDGVDAPRAGFPPELQALTDSVARTGPSSTRPLLAALHPLVEQGVDQQQAAILGFGRFPVAGEARWVHDWWFPRYGPGWRLHQGTDIFAAFGTPVRAPVDGWVRIRNGGLGGLAVYVIQSDGTYFYLAHLSQLGDGITEGMAVRTGQVVGHVGDSGNARGGAPHLHIEIHPRGGGAIDPKPVLDRFVADAIAQAPAVVAAYRPASAAAPSPAVSPAAASARLGALLPAPGLTETAPSRGALLWASSVSPPAGALQLAAVDVGQAAADLDWAAVARAQHDAATAQDLAEWRARLILTPLTPTKLAWAASAAGV